MRPAQLPSATRARWSDHGRALRLVTSGSAALPSTVGERWRALTGRSRHLELPRRERIEAKNQADQLAYATEKSRSTNANTSAPNASAVAGPRLVTMGPSTTTEAVS